MKDIEEVNEDIETVDGVDEEAAPVTASGPRNLTAESIRSWGKARKATALSKVKPGETVKVALPKLGKDGAPVRDANGFTVTEEKTVLKSEHIERQWAEKLGE